MSEPSSSRPVSRRRPRPGAVPHEPQAPVERDSPERERVREEWQRDPEKPERARPSRPGRQPSEST